MSLRRARDRRRSCRRASRRARPPLPAASTAMPHAAESAPRPRRRRPVGRVRDDRARRARRARRRRSTVGRGETVAVVGESGSGKSVTALSVMRLVEHGGGRIIGGHASTSRRRDGTPHRPRARRRRDDARDPRRRDRDDLPGADDLAQPGVHRGRPDRRSRSACTRARIARAARAEALRMLEQVRIPEARAGARRAIRTSCPAACASA